MGPIFVDYSTGDTGLAVRPVNSSRFGSEPLSQEFTSSLKEAVRANSIDVPALTSLRYGRTATHSTIYRNMIGGYN